MSEKIEVWYDIEYNKFRLAESTYLKWLVRDDKFMRYIGVL